jgi:hypothetical protein
MSDLDVIKKFVGNDGKKNKYEVRDDKKTVNTHKEKEPYYPREGVKIELEVQKLVDVAGGAYVKIVVTKGSWGAKNQVEQAVFRVSGPSSLVATDMEVDSGTLLTETLTMMANGHMKHELLFSDGKRGSWICEP